MKNKIKEHIDLIFADAPDCSKTQEMKEEMYANVSDRYDDLIKEGKGEAVAYSISVSGIGDISELIASLKEEYGERREQDAASLTSESVESAPKYTSEQMAEIERWRVRRTVMNSIAVSLYIICWLPLVTLAAIFDAVGINSDFAAAIGIPAMMIMIAGATVLMVVKSSIKPSFIRGNKDVERELDGDEDDDDERSHKRKRKKHPALVAIGGALWTLTVVVYMLVSFVSNAWHLTWMIFLITAAIDNIIDAIFEIAGKKYV